MDNFKIILCTVPLDEGADRGAGELPWNPNIAIVSLIEQMAKCGYRGIFYNIDLLLPSDNEIYEYFNINKPKVVGISAVVSTMYSRVKSIASIIRKASPSTVIVVGGNLAASASIILNKTEVDICVLGDGEYTWLNILDSLKNSKGVIYKRDLLNIKGVAFLNDGGEMEFTGYGDPIPNEENSFPDYDLMSNSRPELLKYYFREGKECAWFNHDIRSFEPDRKPKLATLWTNNGCVAKCTFCQRFIKGLRTYDLLKFDAHLKELKEKYDVGFIQVNGELFGHPKDYAFKVAELFKRYDMLWFAGGVRCTSFNRDDMAYLKECGCTALKFGVESGSWKILDVMEKRFKVEDIFIALENCKNLGLYSPILFCIGMPGETNETIMETGRFLGRVHKMLGVPPLPGAQIFYALPLPGAPLYEYGRLNGIFGDTIDDEEEALLFFGNNRCLNSEEYINLNGSRRKDIVFWEYLLYFEAIKTYYLIHSQPRLSNVKEGSNFHLSAQKEVRYSPLKKYLKSSILCVM
jgi:radical SAM superfamily enzyme YgiQ (UPF0313 family)